MSDSGASTYVSLFIMLLVFDAIWSVYSEQTEGDFTGSPQRVWLLTNLVAAVGLGILYSVYRAHKTEAWPLDASASVLILATVADFRLNWDFYFPRQNRPWRPGRGRTVFLAAPLTQYAAGGTPNPLESFRQAWTKLGDDLEHSGHKIFSAHRREAWGAALDGPAEALRDDIAGLTRRAAVDRLWLGSA